MNNIRCSAKQIVLKEMYIGNEDTEWVTAPCLYFKSNGKIKKIMIK